MSIDIDLRWLGYNGRDAYFYGVFLISSVRTLFVNLTYLCRGVVSRESIKINFT